MPATDSLRKRSVCVLHSQLLEFPHIENLPKPMLGAQNFILAQGPGKG